MPRSFVDFTVVRPEHQQVDALLINWARWALSGSRGGRQCSPMFRLYRPTEQWGAPPAPQAVDASAAIRMQRAVTMLPTKHRLALSWCYIVRSNPRRAAQTCGVTLEGLRELVEDGRQMLINRGIG